MGKLKSSAEETAKGLKNEYPWTLRLGERLFSMVLNYTDLAMDVSRIPWGGMLCH